MIITQGKTIVAVIDEVFVALIKQGKRCRDSSGDCRYGIDDEPNVHCGIGWLLPADNKDIMNYDGNLSDLLSKFSGELGPNESFMLKHECELELLQDFHDYGNSRLREYRMLRELGVNTELLNAWVDIVSNLTLHQEFDK